MALLRQPPGSTLNGRPVWYHVSLVRRLSVERFSVAAAWLKRILILLSIALISLQWANTRIMMLRMNQSSAPVIPSTYYFYHSMATGFREGRVGQVDLAAIRRHADLHDAWAPFERLPREATHEWVSFYTLDIGYSFLVEIARLAFPRLPDNHLRALALQLWADAALVVVVYFLFAQWHIVLGMAAAYLYVSNGPFYNLVSIPFYYYWDIPITFAVLGALLLAYRQPRQTAFWLTLGGLVLGYAVWLRGSWWPLSAFLCLVAAFTPVLRRKLLLSIIVFGVIAAPQVVRSTWLRGQLTFTTRTVWHVALVGLGYYPNPYGLEARDEVIVKLTRDKYGVEFRSDDNIAYEEAAKKEFMEIWRKDRGFVIRSFFGRLKESIAGSTQTSVLSFLFLSNVTYRVLSLIGFIAMVARGGDRRLLALASGGMYIIYVVLTSLFYFVGLAYDNVSQVTLFVLFMGLLDAVWSGAARVVPRLAVRTRAYA
jgi:hypothetical protein